MAIRITIVLALLTAGAAVFADPRPAETCSARYSYATCFAALNR